jgi:hypothetical protein
MKTKTEMLKRACWWVIPVQALFVAFMLATRDNVNVNNEFPLWLLVMLLNLPGGFVAVKLGLASVGGDNPVGLNPAPNPHPVASDVVTFGVSTIFWVAVVWWFQTLVSPRCLKESEDRPRWPEGQ